MLYFMYVYIAFYEVTQIIIVVHTSYTITADYLNLFPITQNQSQK